MWLLLGLAVAYALILVAVIAFCRMAKWSGQVRLESDGETNRARGDLPQVVPLNLKVLPLPFEGADRSSRAAVAGRR